MLCAAHYTSAVGITQYIEEASVNILEVLSLMRAFGTNRVIANEQWPYSIEKWMTDQFAAMYITQEYRKECLSILLSSVSQCR